MRPHAGICRTPAGESFFKRISAHPFYRGLNRISDVDTAADARGLHLSGRTAVEALAQWPERDRCMEGLLPGATWRAG